jgi:hypothetical protein
MIKEETIHREEEHEFNCIQTEKTQEIHESQQVMQGNQESIKETLEVISASLGRIFELYKKQDERLDKGDERFQEILDYMIKKDTTNGFIEKDIDNTKHDIKEGAEKRTTISDRITALEVNYKTIIQMLQALLGGLTLFFVIFLIKTFVWHF